MLQLNTVLILIQLGGIFPFSIPSCFYESLYFRSTKSMDPLTLKCRNSIQNKNNRKATYNLAPGPLIFKLQQKV